MTEERKHHHLSPSRLPRLLACPGSYRMCQGLEEAPAGEAAEEGTFLHEQVEVLVTKGEEHLSKELSPEQEELVFACFDFLSTLCDANGIGISDLVWEEKLTLYAERLPWQDQAEDPPAITHGYADVYGVSDKGHAILLDWKFGRNEVKSDTIQLRAYAGALLQREDVNSVEVVAFQPRVSRAATSVEYFDLPAIRSEVGKVISDATGNGPLHLRSNPGCTWCAARGICPEVRRELDLPLPTGVLTVTNAAVRYDRLTALRKLVDDALDGVKDFVRAHPGEVQGLSTPTRKGGAYVADAEVGYQRMRAHIPALTHEAFMECVEVRQSKLAKLAITLLREQHECSAAEAKDRYVDILGDCLRSKPSTTYIRRSKP